MKRIPLSAVCLAALLAAAQSGQAAKLEYSAGHADIRPLYENGQLSLSYRFDHTAVVGGSFLGLPTGGEAFMDSNDVYVRASDTTLADPSSSDAMLLFSFFPAFYQSLGEPTTPYWVLPQNNVPGEPFFGFSTEELGFGEWGPSVDIALTGFNGPGDFTLYKAGFGPTVQLSTADNATSFTLPQGHDHYNWAFTQPGVYSLEFTISGTHIDDGFKSATDTFFFAVGDSTSIPEPGTLLLAGITLVVGMPRRR